MLVLTRRPGEQIVIADGIRVTVVSVGPGRVKLGIEAPAHVRVDRAEIHDKIQQERATDVLSAVASGISTGDRPGDTQPLVINASDTSIKLHNRIADKLPTPAPAEAEEISPASPDPTPVVNQIPRLRLPRKPR